MFNLCCKLSGRYFITKSRTLNIDCFLSIYKIYYIKKYSIGGVMSEYINKLFSYRKIYDLNGSESFFLNAMKEVILFDKRLCSFYSRLLERRSFHVDQLKTIDDCANIPLIPAIFFKTHEVLSVPKENIKVHATSSGTEGQKSQIFLDKKTISLATKMAIRMMMHHRFISIIPTQYLILGYEPKPGNEMGNVKLATAMRRFAPCIHKTYTLRALGDRYEIDYFGIIKSLKRYSRTKLPVRIMGFPAFLYMIIKTMKESNIKPLKLNKKSIVLTGGGWKNYDDLMIDKGIFYQMIEDYLGIPKENCRDFYSAVEHSVAYPECRHHRMHVPIWSRVIIRDVDTLEPLGFNQPGFLSFISPLVSSQPLHSILMGDLGILRDGSKCGCGITTPYFEVLGRAGLHEGKTCAISALDYIKDGSDE